MMFYNWKQQGHKSNKAQVDENKDGHTCGQWKMSPTDHLVRTQQLGAQSSKGSGDHPVRLLGPIITQELKWEPNISLTAFST